MVFTDHPDYFADNAHAAYKLDPHRILIWLLARMSVDPNKVAMDYTLRCYPKDKLPTTKSGRATSIEECSSYRYKSIARVKPKAIACLGKTSLEAFTGKTGIGEYEGRRLRAWEMVVGNVCKDIWIGHSLAYILISPSDTPRVFRTLFMAAKDAGLNPKINPDIPPFQWRDIL